MFKFKLTPLWLFGIVIIVLVISMLWYNNASIEGFGTAPPSGSDLLKYYPDASKILVDFGTSNRNYIDTNTGNIIRDYDQTISVIDRAGNTSKYIKSELDTAISVKNDEIHKGSTYPAFSMYEESDNEQLFYISLGTKTFIHSVDLSNNKHNGSYVFDSGRLIKAKVPVDISGVAINAGTEPSVSLNNETFDISGISVTAVKLTDGLFYDASSQLLIQKIIIDAATTGTDAATTGTATDGFTLFNNRLSKEEFEGFTTMDGKVTWDIFDRTGAQKLDEFDANGYTSGDNAENLVVKTLNNTDNTAQVVMMTHSDDTVIVILTNVGIGGKNKYKLLGTLRYVGTILEQPVTPPEQPVTPPEHETKGTDLTESAMTELFNKFFYWNATGGHGGSQPMSQDYMLKTDYVPMTCPSCNNGGKCTNCDNRDTGGVVGTTGGVVGTTGGVVGTTGGGIVGTTGGIANNLIDKTSGLADKAIDTGAGLALGTAMLGGTVAAGTVGLGRDAVSGAVGLGRDAVSGTVDLGRDAVGLGRDAVSGTVGLGRDVVTGAVGLGKDAVSGTADFIKNAQYANAGGYASGSNGDLQTRKYVKGQGVKPSGMDPYTYNGLLSNRTGSNYIPITSDFSSFR